MASYYLTPKKSEILQYLYTFRFLSRIHLQQLLMHKDKKRVNSWLHQLTEEEFVGRIYSRKLLENTKPAVYYLNHRGIAYLKEQRLVPSETLKKYYADHRRSESFRNHCLYIATIFLLLHTEELSSQRKATKRRSSLNLLSSFLTKATITKKEFLCDLRPDIYWIRQQTRMQYIIEIIPETMPRFAIRARMKEILQFYSTGSWQNSNEVFPFFAIICTGEKQRKFLIRFFQTLLDESSYLESMTLYLSTRQDIQHNGFWSEIWSVLRT